MLCALYNGHVHVMNYDNQQLFKDFEVFLASYTIRFNCFNGVGIYLLRCVICRCDAQDS